MTKKNKKIMICLLIILFALLVTVISVTVVVNADENESSIHNAEVHRPTKESINTKNKLAIRITAEERELIARIVTCEADEYSVECQRAVASVIFNRLESGKWQKDMNKDGKITVYDIIYYPNAFTPVQDGSLDRCTAPSESAYKAVDYVIKNGPTVPEYVRYFRDYKHFTWQGYKGYTIIDDMYFGYFEDWYKGAW
jgi:spore germination cell wall hydrolase CwlJ-like protein